MVVPVFAPLSRIDATNVVAFADSVAKFVARYRCMVIDCSEVEWIATTGMRLLQEVSRHTQITLANPTPAVHLMAVTFGVDVRLRDGQLSSPLDEPGPPVRRLVSIHIDGKVAS